MEEEDDPPVIPCSLCPTRPAAKVCLNCQKTFCQGCSGLHQKQRATKDHILQPLPPPPSPEPPEEDLGASCAAMSLDDYDYDFQSVSETDPVKLAEAKDMWKKWLSRELELLQQAEDEQEQVMATAKEIISLGDQLLNKSRSHRDFVHYYRTRLPTFEVCKQTGPSHFMLCAEGGHKSLVNSVHFERRLKDIREGPDTTRLKDAENLRLQLGELIHCPRPYPIPPVDEEDSSQSADSSPASAQPDQVSTSTTETYDPSHESQPPQPREQE